MRWPYPTPTPPASSAQAMRPGRSSRSSRPTHKRGNRRVKVAGRPTQRPPDARLLVVDGDGRLRHAMRAELADYLHPGDLLVANDAATIPASLSGVHERSGAAVEIRLAGRRSLA